MENSLISIIVPVYNVEQYLEKCISSIICQSYSNLQIIVVDDGATDRSGILADELTTKDSRIEVHHKQNGGLSSARNEGLKYVKGEYIMFIDSDDYMSPDMCGTLLRHAQDTGSELTECGFIKVYSNHSINVSPSKTVVSMSGYEAVKAYLSRSYGIQSAVVVALYRTSLLKGIRFEEGRLHEDGWFKYLPLYKAKSVTLIPDCLYYYVQERPGSIMTTNIKEKNIRDVLDALYVRWHFFEDKNEDEIAQLAKACYLRNLLSYYYIALYRIQDKKLSLEIANELKLKLETYKGEILTSEYLKKSRIKFQMFYHFPRISAFFSKFRS